MIRELEPGLLVSGQVAASEISSLAAMGVTILVNNRPDGEDHGQPRSTEIELAALGESLAYRFVPIGRGIGPSEVEAMRASLRQARGGKLLAFCRSGTRSALALALALRAEGRPQGDVRSLLLSAGFEPDPIAHL